MAQWVEDQALLLPWLWLQLWHGFNPWTGNFCLPWVWPKNPENLIFWFLKALLLFHL